PPNEPKIMHASRIAGRGGDLFRRHVRLFSIAAFAFAATPACGGPGRGAPDSSIDVGSIGGARDAGGDLPGADAGVDARDATLAGDSTGETGRLDGSPPRIATSGLASALVGQAYQQTLAVIGGTPPLIWSIA